MWQHSGLYECSTNDLGSSKFAPHLERLYGGFKGQIHNYRSKLKCARHRWKSERVIFSGFQNYYRGKERGRDRGVGNTKTDKETETSQSKGYWTLIKNEGNLLQARSSAHCQRTDILRYHKNWDGALQLDKVYAYQNARIFSIKSQFQRPKPDCILNIVA